MNTLEKKMDAIMHLITADSDDERKKAMDTVRSLMDHTRPAARAMDAEDVVRDILLELGAPDHLVGHPYMIRAILLVANHRKHIDSITSSLYPTLAAQFDTTAARVERAMRHLIEVTWTRGDLDVLNKYFGNTVNCEKGKPTNSEFIARIANVVKMRMKDAA